MGIAKFWMGYKIYLASLKSILIAASVVRGTILKPTIYTFAYLHDINFHSFNTHP